MGDSGAAVGAKGPAGRPLHETLFLVYVFLLPVQAPALVTRPFAVFVGDLALVAALVAGLVAALRGRLRPSGGPLAWAFAVYLAATLPSVVLSDDPRRSALKWCLEGCYFVTALAALQVAASLPALRRLVLAWLGGTAVTVAVALLTVLLFYAGVRWHWLEATQSGPGSLPAGHYIRPAALFHNGQPNSLAHYLSLSLVLVPMSAALGWLSRRKAWALGGCVAATLLLTLSPHVGGAALGLGWWLGWVWRARGQPGRALVALGLGLAVGVALFLAVLVSPASGGPRGVEVLGRRIEPSARVLCWQSAWGTFVEHPWFGRGVGLQTACPDYWTASGALARLVDAHNSYLSLAATKGLAGLSAFAFVVFTLLRRGVPLPAPGPPAAAAVAALTIAVAQALLYQGLSGSFEFVGPVWVAAGLLFAAQDLHVAAVSKPA